MALLLQAFLFMAVTCLLCPPGVKGIKQCKVKIWRAFINTAELCKNVKPIIEVKDFKMRKDGRFIEIFSGSFDVPEDIQSPIMVEYDLQKESAVGTRMNVATNSFEICESSKTDSNKEDHSKEIKMIAVPIEKGSNIPLTCPFRKGHYEAWNVTYEAFDKYEGQVPTGKYAGVVKIVKGSDLLICVDITGELRLDFKMLDCEE